jgi:hypothetical protein
VPLTKEEITDGASWQDINWEAIPSTFWSSCQIDWEKCQAKSSTAAYESMVLYTEDLFREFPLPASQDAPGVGKIGDYLILSDEAAGPLPKSGRPPLPFWDDFHLELAKRVVNGTLRQKQEAFIADMTEWCKDRGHSPGRSTLLQKIKPYYDEFIRSEKVRK